MLGLNNQIIILDGDEMRKGISKGLDYNEEGLKENCRRVSEIAKIISQQGLICIVALVSPIEKYREASKQLHIENGIKWLEIYVSTPLEVCVERDPKKLYKDGKINKYEDPNDPY